LWLKNADFLSFRRRGMDFAGAAVLDGFFFLKELVKLKRAN
jgi:hypothetical protein